MINQVAIRLVEKLVGKALPILLEETTGVTSKTWKKGGPTSPAVIVRAKQRVREKALEGLHAKSGFSYDETVAFLQHVNNGSESGPWFDLVRTGVLPEGPHRCPVTETLARQLDELGDRLDHLRQAQDLIAYREALLSSGFLQQGDEWLRRFWGTEAARFRDTQVTSWGDMRPLMESVSMVALFRLMASWDVEFHAHCLTDQKTGRGLLPLPLFAQVLPRLRPGSLLNAQGEYPSRGLFHLPLRRLLEFSHCLATYHRTRSWPAKGQVSRTQVAAAGGVLLQGLETTEQPLAKIYSGTRDLKGGEFSEVWDSMCRRQGDVDSHMAPWPLYLAAQLWTVLFVAKATNNKTSRLRHVIVLDDDAYQHWWESSLSEFRARGTRFGNWPWPEYMRNG